MWIEPEYADCMPAANTGLAPIPRSPNLEKYSGYWVALVDGTVVAAEPTSHELAFKLSDMAHFKHQRLSIEYVRPSSDAYVVGVG